MRRSVWIFCICLVFMFVLVQLFGEKLLPGSSSCVCWWRTLWPSAVSRGEQFKEGTGQRWSCPHAAWPETRAADRWEEICSRWSSQMGGAKVYYQLHCLQGAAAPGWELCPLMCVNRLSSALMSPAMVVQTWGAYREAGGGGGFSVKTVEELAEPRGARVLMVLVHFPSRACCLLSVKKMVIGSERRSHTSQGGPFYILCVPLMTLFFLMLSFSC